MPRLPPDPGLSAPGRVMLRRLAGLFNRDVLEQSAAERLVTAACATGLLWLAIYWALS